MPAAIVEFTGVYLVQWVVLTKFGGPDIAVHGRHTAIGRYIVQPAFGGPDSGNRMTEINKGPG